MRTVPFDRPFTRPEPSTDATFWSLLLQVAETTREVPSLKTLWARKILLIPTSNGSRDPATLRLVGIGTGGLVGPPFPQAQPTAHTAKAATHFIALPRELAANQTEQP